MPDGFIAELTYGTEVNWYRNIVKSGGEIGHRGRMYRITSVEEYPRGGLRAFGRQSSGAPDAAPQGFPPDPDGPSTPLKSTSRADTAPTSRDGSDGE